MNTALIGALKDVLLEDDLENGPDWGRYGRYGEINYITRNFKTISTFWNGLGLEWDPDLSEQMSWCRTLENSKRSWTIIGPQIEIR